MKTTILIPTHMRSRRFPMKALAPLRGASGIEQSLVQRCYNAATQVPNSEVMIATDTDKIEQHVHSFGGLVVRTQQAENGTDRCAQAAAKIDADLIINFQGDAPLIPADFVTALIDFMQNNPDAQVATPVMPCDAEMLARLRAERHQGRIGGTTAATDLNGRALYFSKELLPVSDGLADRPNEVKLHIGLYAYRRDAVANYPNLAQGRLEMIEGLEQLRFLENSVPVHCVEVDAKGRAFWEVNNPEDVPVVEAALTQRGIE